MVTKVCSKCKRELDISYFYKNKSKPGGVTTQCKFCCKKYQEEHEKEIAEYQHTWYNKNSERILKRQKQYYIDKVKGKLTYKRISHKNNVEHIASLKARKATRNKQRLQNKAVFKTYHEKLKVFEEVRQCPKKSELLEVKCAYCGKWMQPTNVQVVNRLQVFNGQMPGECRFYCSENCKKACPTFNQKKYPKGFKKATSREVVPLLRQLVLERDNYTCQMCGATTEDAQLHVHHEKSYTLNKIMANDPDNCWTLCKKCHKKVHSEHGCRYVDLKCENKANA